jgi:hypothetical protein
MSCPQLSQGGPSCQHEWQCNGSRFSSVTHPPSHFHSLSLGNKSKDELERAVEGEKNRREREGEKQEENNTTSSS